MIRLLIVDDDVALLAALSRTITRREKEWEVRTCSSGQEALAMLPDFDWDAVLSDLQMPGMDGEALLRAVAARSGKVLRLLHSGAPEQARIIQAAGIAHHAFEKPCLIEDVIRLVRRAHQVRILTDSPAVEQELARGERIPAVPQTFFGLQRLIAQGDFYLPRLVSAIEREPSAVIALLRAANTAYFAGGTMVRSIEQALCRLGINTVSAILLQSELYSHIPRETAAKLRLEESSQHAVRIGELARRYSKECGAPDKMQHDCFLAGVLSEVGTLMFAQLAPAKLDRLLQQERNRGIQDLQIEREILGLLRSEVAAHFLGLWGMPVEVVEAVAFHLEPYKAEQQAAGILSYIAAAGLMLTPAREMTHELHDYFTEVGLRDKLSEWQEGGHPVL